MEERIKLLNQKITEYFEKENPKHSFMYNNIEIFYHLSVQLEDLLKNLNDLEDIKDDYFKTTPKANLRTKINLIKEFCIRYDIPIDIDNLLKNKTIKFYDYNPEKVIIKGTSTYEDDKHIVKACNNELLIDTLILYHELSHNRNSPHQDKRDIISHLLSECLAVGDELILLEYIENKTNSNIANMCKINKYKKFYRCSKCTKSLYKIVFLYRETGNVSKETYQAYFNNLDEFDTDVNVSLKEFNRENFCLKYYAAYILAAYISSYIYLEFLKDEQFMKKINLLHNNINDLTFNLKSLLNIIGIEGLGKAEYREILVDSVKELVEQITKNEVKKKEELISSQCFGISQRFRFKNFIN